MFDIVVVAVLLALTLIAVTRFPAEGRSAAGRFMFSRPVETPRCRSCHAAVIAHDRRCETCGAEPA